MCGPYIHVLIFYTSRLSNNSLSQENVIYIGSLNNLIFETTLINNGPNVAYAVLFKVIHPDSLTFSKVEEGDFTCTSTINITKCDIATSFNPSDSVSSVVHTVLFICINT